MKRAFAALLSGLLAWACVTTVDPSVPAPSGDATFAADAHPAVLAKAARPDPRVARTSAGTWLLAVPAAAPGPPPPSAAFAVRSAPASAPPATRAGSPRSTRGPPG